jgi:hypothetical protein
MNLKSNLINFMKKESSYNKLSHDEISSWMKMTVFWNVAQCSLVEIDRRFRGDYCLHHQGLPSSLMIEAVSTSVYSTKVGDIVQWVTYFVTSSLKIY